MIQIFRGFPVFDALFNLIARFSKEPNVAGRIFPAITVDARPDMSETRDAHYPFQQGYPSRGSPTPYVIGGLLLAILAVMGLNIVSVDEGDMLGTKQVVTASTPAASNSANF